MKNHTKVYFKYFGFSGQEFISCECCGARAVDIHHIDSRGMGGSKQKDVIEYLMAVCRSCHEKYGDKQEHYEYLYKVHKKSMNEAS